MKYYSEVLDRFYDDADKLVNDEKTHLAIIAEAEKMKTEEQKRLSSMKKDLSLKIDDAEKEVQEAYAALDAARAHCREIVHETNKKLDSIMSEARAKLKNAQKNKIEAVQKFNEQFGPYKVSYTGAKAKEELDRIQQQWDSMISHLFGGF